MTVVAMGSVKAAPGVSTACIALATAWPREGALVLEADADGGVLAARAGLDSEPGLTTLAAGARRPDAANDLIRHAQILDGGVPVVAAPPAAEQVHAALAAGATLGEVVRRDAAVDVLLDCGRLAERSPSLPLALEADLILLLTRPRLEELGSVAPRLEALRERGAPVAILLVGDRPYRPEEVQTALRADVMGWLADDPAGAIAIGAGRPGRSPHRWRLLRTARTVSARIVDHLEGPSSQETGSGVEEQP